MEFLSEVWVLLKWVIIPIVGLCPTALQYGMFAIFDLSFRSLVEGLCHLLHVGSLYL